MIDIESLAELIDWCMEAGNPALLKYTFLFSLGISLAIVAVFFLLRAVGLYRLNRRLGNKYACLAFVPGLSGYALGAAADGLKKRKPSNYCIHMLMLGLFHFALNVVSYIYVGGRILFLYEKLTAGGEIDTVQLLTRVFTVDQGDQPLYLVTLALSIVDYVVVFVSLLCYMRILQLYRRGGFFVLFCTILVPQVMDVYLFAMRKHPIYEHPPVFRMPDGTTFGSGFDDRDDDSSCDSEPNDSDEGGGSDDRTNDDNDNHADGGDDDNRL